MLRDGTIQWAPDRPIVVKTGQNGSPYLTNLRVERNNVWIEWRKPFDVTFVQEYKIVISDEIYNIVRTRHPNAKATSFTERDLHWGHNYNIEISALGMSYDIY